MKRMNLIVAGSVALSMVAGPGGGVALASSKLHVTVSPKTVVAGHALTVRVSRTGGRRCVLSLRADRRGSLARYRRKVSVGRTVVAIPATAAAGPRVATVRCGARTTAAHFQVAAGKGVALGDEQGFVPSASGSQATAPTGGQLGGGAYSNARIADIGLSKVGQNLYTPGLLDHGQCKQAANDWVALASGNTQVMGTDYHDNYANEGGTQVSRDDAAKGDVIQLDNPSDITRYYHGMHTAVVVSHAAGSNTFDVVDSNFHSDDVVGHHTWDPYEAAQKYGLRVTIWRMGTADPAPQVMTPPPANHGETTGGPTNTWTNYANAGGNQGPTIPANQTVQIACKLQGFRVADGDTWWYRIASDPWKGTYYASADAFYNNGQTSGSLHGTPFFDGAVPDC